MVKRTIVGVILVGVLCAMIHFGGWLQCAVFTLVAVLSVYEMGHALEKIGQRPFLLPAYAFGALYYVFYKLFGGEMVLLLAVVSIMAIITERIFDEKRETQATIFSLFMFIYPISFYVILMFTMEFENQNLSRIAMLSIFAMPCMGDALAYFIGRFFGKKKLAPKISPNKTIAGSIAGIFGGMIGGLISYLVQGIYPAEIPLYVLLILGALLGIAGQIGDLFASSIKRWTGIKDYGKILPGHGGMLDRFDSVLFCAPIAFLFFSLVAI